MNKVKKGLSGLKKVEDYSAKDLKSAQVSKEALREYEAIRDMDIPSQALARNLMKEVLREEVATMHALRRQYGSTKQWANFMPSAKNKDALCIMFSDWHVGKYSTDAEGVLRYSTELACHLGSKVYAERILAYLAKHNLAKQIDEVYLLLLGDLIDNEIIYDTQVHHIEMPVELQRKHATKALIDFIDYLEQGLAKMGLKHVAIKIKGIRGNHGRVNKGPLEVSSWEVVIYDSLDVLFASMKKKNISVDYTRYDSKIIDVKGKKGLMRHKAPPQAETSGARAKLGGWHELWDWDFLVHGHFHHYGINSWNSKPVFRNGSFVGPDDLSDEMGVRDKRCQLIFGVNETDVPSFMHRVVLD